MKRKSGLTRKVKSVIKQLNEIDERIIIDLCLCLLDKDDVEEYCGEIDNFGAAVMLAVEIIRTENPAANKIVMNMIKCNKKYLELLKEYTMEELEKEYRKDLVFALHNQISITPEMIILHYIVNELEKDFIFEHAVNYYHKNREDFLKNRKEYVDEIKLKFSKNSIFEKELNDFYHGIVRNNDVLLDEEYLKDLAERYNGELNGDNITINNRILSFYDINAEFMVKDREIINNLLKMSIVEYNKAYLILNKTKNIIDLHTEISALKNKIDILEGDKKFLEEKLDEKSDNNKDDSLKLEKENYYLHSKVEKLALENEELRQIIKELKEIVEDLPINVEKIEPTNTYEGESIVIIGGNWTDREKDNIRANYIADFIEAEDTLKYTERIKNYNVIIFDTSRNSHTNFNRFKGNSKLKLISKSKKENIDDLFMKK